MKPLFECPLCPEKTGVLVPVHWEMSLNGRASTFMVGCCPMDATLCGVFPSLKRALFQSQAAQEMLRRLV